MGVMTRQIAALTLGRKQIERLKPWLKNCPPQPELRKASLGGRMLSAALQPPQEAIVYAVWRSTTPGGRQDQGD